MIQKCRNYAERFRLLESFELLKSSQLNCEPAKTPEQPAVSRGKYLFVTCAKQTSCLTFRPFTLQTPDK
jgi:hypothetical protein